MNVYKPSEFAIVKHGGAVTAKTVINWCKSGVLAKEGYRIEQTPTGRYLIYEESRAPSNIDRQFEEIMARRNQRKVS